MKIKQKIFKKQFLPEKICVGCHKPFSWRKKWERNWEEVKYCSDRCRHQGGVQKVNKI